MKNLIWVLIFSCSTFLYSQPVDTLYYFDESGQFINEFAIASEAYSSHTIFEPDQNWQSYKVLEIHYLISTMRIGDTIHTIGFYKDTLQTELFSFNVNRVIDSSITYPNWYKVQVPLSPIFSEPVEVKLNFNTIADLCRIEPTTISGQTLGYDILSDEWLEWYDLPVKLVVQAATTGVEDKELNPGNFYLAQNYPNPFNPSTKIKFTIPFVATRDRVSVQLKVYNILGNEVVTLVDEFQPAGNYEIDFDASKLPSGVYFYTLTAGEYKASKKMILLK